MTVKTSALIVSVAMRISVHILCEYLNYIPKTNPKNTLKTRQTTTLCIFIVTHHVLIAVICTIACYFFRLYLKFIYLKI